MTACGCLVETLPMRTDDAFGVKWAPAIVYCPLHAAAEQLADMIGKLFRTDCTEGCATDTWDSEARALLKEIGR